MGSGNATCLTHRSCPTWHVQRGMSSVACPTWRLQRGVSSVASLVKQTGHTESSQVALDWPGRDTRGAEGPEKLPERLPAWKTGRAHTVVPAGRSVRTRCRPSLRALRFGVWVRGPVWSQPRGRTRAQTRPWPGPEREDRRACNQRGAAGVWAGPLRASPGGSWLWAVCPARGTRGNWPVSLSRGRHGPFAERQVPALPGRPLTDPRPS